LPPPKPNPPIAVVAELPVNVEEVMEMVWLLLDEPAGM
jgi:hypothetical protein